MKKSFIFLALTVCALMLVSCGNSGYGGSKGGSIIPTQNILLSLWGDDDFFNARSLQVLITRMRHRFSRDPRIQILNVRGTGYKLIAE